MTYKRPLPEGVECEDLRSVHSPMMGKTPEVKSEPQEAFAPKATKKSAKAEVAPESEAEVAAETPAE